MKPLIALGITLCAYWSAQAHHEGRPFIPLFQMAAGQYWNDTPHNWRLLYELAFAESSFRPNVQSHVGAIGLLQVMPATYQEIQQHLADLSDNLADPSDNIRAGAFYLRTQYNIWQAQRPEPDRVRLALASYNAGAGHLIAAQQVADGSPYWQDIAKQLHTQTGSHAPGTIKYAESIWERYDAAKVEKDELGIIHDKGSITVDKSETTPQAQATTSTAPAVNVVVQPPSSPLPWDALIAALFGLMQWKPRKEE